MFPLISPKAFQFCCSAISQAESANETNYQLFDSPEDAFKAVLKLHPKILAIGEYHESNNEQQVESALKRFTKQLLLFLKGEMSDLVVETWVIDGKCGKAESYVNSQISSEINRPKHTKDELASLLQSSSQQGIQPHILKISCSDYAKLFSNGSTSEEFSLLLKRLIQRKVKTIFQEKTRTSKKPKQITIYCGALHNDIYPQNDLKDYSFGRALNRLSQGKYVELDLIVPEYIENDPDAAKMEWFPIFKRNSSKTKILLINPKPNSYILIFPKS